MTKLTKFLKDLAYKLHSHIYSCFNRGLGKSNFKPLKVLKGESSNRLISAMVMEWLNQSEIYTKKKKSLGNSSDIWDYRYDFYDDLPIEIRAYIYSHFIGDNSICDHLRAHFGFQPRLQTIELLYNYPNHRLSEEGSKLWHRDLDCDFKNTKVFIMLTPIHSGNGPFYYLNNSHLNTIRHKISSDTESSNTWLRGRITNAKFTQKCDDICTTEGFQQGDTIMIDTVNLYHKGGFCKESTRLLLHASYQGTGWTSIKKKDFSSEVEYLTSLGVTPDLHKKIREQDQLIDNQYRPNNLKRFARKLNYKLRSIY